MIGFYWKVQAAGQNPFMRALGAGQFGAGLSQAEAQRRLEAQMAVLGLLGQPTGQTTRSSPGIGGILGGLGGLAFGGLGLPYLQSQIFK